MSTSDVYELFSQYPDHPGFKARDTSRDAAEAIAPAAKTLRAQVYEEIKRLPGTPEQIAKRLMCPLMNVRPRCSELAAQGLIADSGMRGQASGGRRAIVWCVPPAAAQLAA